jgi:hypothetical protein
MTAMTKRNPPARLPLFGDCEGVGVVAPAEHLLIYHSKKKLLLTNGPVADAARSLILASLTITVQAAGGRQRPPTVSGQSESNKQDGQTCVDNWQRDAKNAETAFRQEQLPAGNVVT